MRARLLAAFAAIALAMAAPSAFAGGNQNGGDDGGGNPGGGTTTINNDVTVSPKITNTNTNVNLNNVTNTFKPTNNNTFNPTNNVDVTANGGKAKATSTSNATATSTSSATGGNASATGGSATSSSGGNTFSVVDNQVRQTPSVSANGAALAGMAASDCVLSDTKSIFASFGMPMAAVGGGYADGKTRPYDECNARETVKILAQMQGTKDHPGFVYRNGKPYLVSWVINQIVVDQLTGVNRAMDELDGKTTQTGGLPTTNGSSQQVAETPKKAKSDSCSEPNASAWYKSNCLD